ncbi:ABC transporter ATP-binding protein [Cellulosilyticum ruminicola]|uniref:ABC transporter ATP-binding protein n=1 Tax=Cellulosilyticum ruminicola TaxID=425254 RepID=UPI0006CF373A|nr:ABC transporter ATP-binding protein [Cellulosilyticum ruminicola]
MEDIVIRANNLTKIYKLYDNPVDRLKESLSLTKKKYHKEHYALKDISFEIKKGETVGIIGTNGSGKSTLLKIITGVLNRTDGELEVKGKISALLELGAGFNMEYTGRENIYLNGTMLGYSKEEMDEKLDDIIEFADIGYFIDQPVKTYSSGMFVRLAFAVSINVNPEILIIDEALSVGDIRFQQKCYRKIEEFKENKTVIMVSHDIGSINKFSDRVIWIEQGKLMGVGKPMEISKQYQAYLMDSKISHNASTQKASSVNYNLESVLNKIDESFEVYGDKRAIIEAVGLVDENNVPLEIVTEETAVRFLMKVRYDEDLVNPIVGFTINDRLGNIIFQSNSYVLDASIDSSQEVALYEFKFKMPPLNQGTYTISPAVASGVQEQHMQHNWVHDAYIFNFITKSNYALQGTLYMTNIEFGVV